MIFTNPKCLIAANNNDLLSLKDESTLNLHFHIKDVDSANREIDACISHLKIAKTSGDVNVNGDQIIDRIKGTHFLDLYNKAKELNDSVFYLTGLKIIFGIDTANKICLVYQPVCLFYEKEIPLGSKVCLYKIIEGDSFQYDIGNGFTPINLSDKNELVTAYKSKIQIKHNDSETFSPFLQDIDVESMVFSFQEIFALMYENKKVDRNHDIFDETNNDPVLIYNCIRTNSINCSFLNKHSLLLSTISSDKMGFFEGKFANLAHLCPPNCADDSFVFRLESMSSNCD